MWTNCNYVNMTLNCYNGEILSLLQLNRVSMGIFVVKYVFVRHRVRSVTALDGK